MIEGRELTATMSESHQGRWSLPEKKWPTESTIIPSFASSFAIQQPPSWAESSWARVSLIKKNNIEMTQNLNISLPRIDKFKSRLRCYVNFAQYDVLLPKDKIYVMPF